MKIPFNSFVNGLTKLSQNQILLAILGGVTSLSVFGVWKWNQEQHQKFIAEQKAKCQSELETAWRIVNRSKTLYKLMLKTESKQLLPLSHPDVNTKFEKDRLYILLYTEPHTLIPEYPIYDDPFFYGLAQTGKKSYPPLLVQGKSSSRDKVTVFTYCSPQRFEVSKLNLYETSQKNDFPKKTFIGF